MKSEVKKVKRLIENDSVVKMDVNDMDNYLKGYGLNMRLLKMDKYEREYFGYKESEESLMMTDVTVARAKMYEVRHFIMGMKNSDEKLLLYYHYIRGESVERCAELLGISRSSGFRLKKRALNRAIIHMNDV